MAYQQQLSAERLWNVLFSPEVAYSPNEIPLVVSLCYYATTMVVGRLLRALNQTITPASYHDLVADAILTFQVCACSLENIMLRNSYGVGGYALVLFALSIWFSFTIRQGRGNPCANVVDYAQGGQSLRWTSLRCALQLAGGVLSYQYAKTFWSLELTAGHGHRFRMPHCTAGLTVPSPIGLGLEFGATFVECMLCMATFTPFYVCETLSKAVLSVIMTCMGVHMTGMYLNPVNAFTQEFGCRGVNAAEHLLVYWGGPFLAAVLATLLQRHMRELLKTMPARDVERKTRSPEKNSSPRHKASPSKKAAKNKSHHEKGEASPRKATLRRNAKKDKSS